jgi:serine/threonine-protein kinase RsbW
VDYLEQVESITVQVANEVRFTDSAIENLSIAITELFNNAVHHGNKDDLKKIVTLTFTFNSGKLLVSVKDQGQGFSPDSIRDPLAPENLLAESGRGIYLVRSLMDDIAFNMNHSGSEIIITKYLC